MLVSDTGSKGLSPGWKKSAENEKPPTALAGGGLGVDELQNPVRQALFPRALWTLIRMAGIDTNACWAGEAFAGVLNVCMMLSEVEQSGRGQVKR
jgi:hypothetical protein